MLSKKKANLTILIVTGILILFGLFMITSAGSVISQENFGNAFYYTKSQLLKGLLPGLFLGFLAYLTPYQYLRKFSTIIFGGCILLMIAVFVPHIGLAFGGAKRWIGLGSFNFQPSEFFKIGFVVYLAALLEKAKKFSGKNNSHVFISFLAILIMTGILIGLQPDLGTLGIFILTALAMYFSAQAPIRHILALTGLGFAGFAIFVELYSHAMQRVQVLFNPRVDPQGISYQVNQGLIALGSGGIFGQGLGQGREKFLYLPQPTGDSIVAVIGEELGFLGLLVLTSLFITFAIQGFAVAKKAPDDFSKFLVIGLTCLIVIQAFVNIMAVSGIIPLTGVTLPFVSYGGTSLVVSLIAVGLILNISRYISYTNQIKKNYS